MNRKKSKRLIALSGGHGVPPLPRVPANTETPVSQEVGKSVQNTPSSDSATTDGWGWGTSTHVPPNEDACVGKLQSP